MSDRSAIPVVSVVVAAYNMGQYIEVAVRSVLDQTFSDLEVIVVDDGSTDGTPDVMCAFEQESRVRYIRQANAGQPRAKNAGVKAARGRFIAFCDADDVWVVDKLSKQLRIFDADDRIGVVYSQVATIDPDGNRTGEITGDGPSGSVLNELFVKNFVPFGTSVVRREVIDEIGMFDETLAMGIDWDLWLRAAVRWRFHFMREPLYLYRVWPGQMSRNWKGRYEHCFRIMQNFLKQHPDLVDRRVVRRAYADSYVGRGICHWLLAGDRRSARADYLTALRHDPTFLSAWFELLKLPLRRPRRPD